MRKFPFNLTANIHQLLSFNFLTTIGLKYIVQIDRKLAEKLVFTSSFAGILSSDIDRRFQASWEQFAGRVAIRVYIKKLNTVMHLRFLMLRWCSLNAYQRYFHSNAFELIYKKNNYINFIWLKIKVQKLILKKIFFN